MKRLFVTVDFNGYHLHNDGVVWIYDDIFDKFKPLIDAINSFVPYIARNEYGGVCYCNWEAARPDMGEISEYEKYNQFSKRYINEFKKVFLDCIRKPEYYCIDAFHRIIELKDADTGELYIDGRFETVKERKPQICTDYERELTELYSYKRNSDGKSLMSIPFDEMTIEENELLDKTHNLWKKYVLQQIYQL